MACNEQHGKVEKIYLVINKLKKAQYDANYDDIKNNHPNELFMTIDEDEGGGGGGSPIDEGTKATINTISATTNTISSKIDNLSTDIAVISSELNLKSTVDQISTDTNTINDKIDNLSTDISKISADITNLSNVVHTEIQKISIGTCLNYNDAMTVFYDWMLPGVQYEFKYPCRVYIDRFANISNSKLYIGDRNLKQLGINLSSIPPFDFTSGTILRNDPSGSQIFGNVEEKCMGVIPFTDVPSYTTTRNITLSAYTGGTSTGFYTWLSSEYLSSFLSANEINISGAFDVSNTETTPTRVKVGYTYQSYDTERATYFTDISIPKCEKQNVQFNFKIPVLNRVRIKVLCNQNYLTNTVIPVVVTTRSVLVQKI